MMPSMLFVLALVVLVLELTVESTNNFASCGDCWCSYSNQSAKPGTPGGCPIWQPTMNWPNITMDTYRQQVPTFLYSLACNPYSDPTCQTTPPQQYKSVSTAVCGLLYSQTDGVPCSDYTYTMITYQSSTDAVAAGAQITHYGSCGTCSSTLDLATYMTVDLTGPGKACGVLAVTNHTAGLICWMEIGLTYGCAQINNYNAIYDQTNCAVPCVTISPTAPNNGPPPACALNKCLQCDETKSDALFKSFGGRSRRDTGLQSEIIRPCDSIAYLPDHNPCPNNLTANLTLAEVTVIVTVETVAPTAQRRAMATIAFGNNEMVDGVGDVVMRALNFILLQRDIMYVGNQRLYDQTTTELPIIEGEGIIARIEVVLRIGSKYSVSKLGEVVSRATNDNSFTGWIQEEWGSFLGESADTFLLKVESAMVSDGTPSTGGGDNTNNSNNGMTDGQLAALIIGWIVSGLLLIAIVAVIYVFRNKMNNLMLSREGANYQTVDEKVLVVQADTSDTALAKDVVETAV